MRNHLCECGTRHSYEELLEIDPDDPRLEWGGPLPSGVCPQCGELCYYHPEVLGGGHFQVAIQYTTPDGTVHLKTLNLDSYNKLLDRTGGRRFELEVLKVLLENMEEKS